MGCRRQIITHTDDLCATHYPCWSAGLKSESFRTMMQRYHVRQGLNTTPTRNQIEVPIRTTVGLKNVNSTELSSLAIPLPPLAEQRRIVAKVDELLTLFARLESRLTAAQAESGRLLEAVLHEALATTADKSL
jgi:type I restriction enzyme, S subunit